MAMNVAWQQIGVVLAVTAAVAYLAAGFWRRATGQGGSGHAGGCGSCAKCPSSDSAADGVSMQGKALPLVGIDLVPNSPAKRNG